MTVYFESRGAGIAGIPEPVAWYQWEKIGGKEDFCDAVRD